MYKYIKKITIQLLILLSPLSFAISFKWRIKKEKERERRGVETKMDGEDLGARVRIFLLKENVSTFRLPPPTQWSKPSLVTWYLIYNGK